MKGDKSEACAKIGFATRAEALDALKKITKARGGRGLKVYSCPRCPYWHLGRGRKAKTWRRSRESGGAGKNYGPKE